MSEKARKKVSNRHVHGACPDCSGFAYRVRAWLEPMPGAKWRKQRVELWQCYRTSMESVCSRPPWWVIFRGPGVVRDL